MGANAGGGRRRQEMVARAVVRAWRDREAEMRSALGTAPKGASGAVGLGILPEIEKQPSHTLLADGSEELSALQAWGGRGWGHGRGGKVVR